MELIMCGLNSPLSLGITTFEEWLDSKGPCLIQELVLLLNLILHLQKVILITWFCEQLIVKLQRLQELLTGIEVFCVLGREFFLFNVLILFSRHGHLNECSQNFHRHCSHRLGSLLSVPSTSRQQVILTLVFLSDLDDCLVAVVTILVSSYSWPLAEFHRHEREKKQEHGVYHIIDKPKYVSSHLIPTVLGVIFMLRSFSLRLFSQISKDVADCLKHD